MKQKTRSICVFAVFILVAAYVAIIAPMKAAARKRERAEIHMIEVIMAQVGNHLDAGGAWPTNWFSLSNVLVSMERWDLVEGIAARYSLPRPTKLYTVLPRPIDWNDRHRSVFLIGSEPRRHSGLERGRWAVGIGYGLTNFPYSYPNATGNHPWRAWIEEKYLPPEIRAQLLQERK